MRTIRVTFLLALGMLFPAMLAAQAPIVTAVLNQRSRDARLSAGVLASIQGANFDDTATVTVGGRPAAVLEHLAAVPVEGILEEALQVQLPVELMPGETTLAVTTRYGSSAPFGITLHGFAPALSGFASREFPSLVPTFSCSPPITATPGDMVTVTAIGLGATDPVVPTGTLPAVAAPTVAKPSLTVGGQPAEVLESVLSAYQVGVYWVTFRVPPAQGGHDLILNIGGTTSNREFLPVGRTTLDLSAAWSRGAAASESIRVVHACGFPFLAGAEPGSLNTPSFTGDPRNPQTTLGGVTVRVIDSSRVERLAPLFYVSPSQVNYMLPAGTPNGYATVKVSGADGNDLASTVEVQTVAPTVFSAALVVRLRDGVQTVQTVFPAIAAGGGTFYGGGFSAEGERLDGLPIDMGPDTDVVYLVLFGTGLRFRSSPATVRIGGVDAPVEYAAAQSEFAGVDQVNISLPRSLVGRGDTELQLTVDGSAANIMYLTFQ